MSEFEAGSVDTGNPVADAAGMDAQQPSGGSYQQPGAQAEGAWYSGLPEETRGLAELKGWKSPDDAVQSYMNLEKMLGADKAGRGLVIPKDDADQTEWGQFYDRLGRPKTPEEYNLPIPEGDTGEFAGRAKNKFHEIGITAKQANDLAQFWNQEQEEAMRMQQQAQMQNSEMEMQTLQSEWGKQFDENVEAARRATRQFGIDENKLSAIENAIGTKEMMKMFASIGKGLAEDKFIDNEKASGFGMSPEAARVQLGRLKSDPAWAAKYLAGDAEARNKMESLMRAAYPN